MNPRSQTKKPPAARSQQARQRQISMPTTSKQQRRRGNLLLAIGFVMILITGLGFWFVLQTIDERKEYLMALRTINRSETVTLGDFAIVKAHIGPASALAPQDFNIALSGKAATGMIPKGTLVTSGMFAHPNMSSEAEKDSIVIRLPFPQGDSPYGSVQVGDTLALIGREGSENAGTDADLGENPLGDDPSIGNPLEATAPEDNPLVVIGVITIDNILGGTLTYVVPPEEALLIEHMLTRYQRASDRKMWLLGTDVTPEELNEKLANFESDIQYRRDPIIIGVN